MLHQLNYRIRQVYQTSKGGISIPVVLTAGSLFVEGDAKIDTGSEYCLFQRRLADALELDLENGHQIQMETLAGIFTAYGHEVTLQTFDLAFDALVYFAADYGIPRNLLGRNGWLQQVRLGLNDYDETLYLSAYDDL